MRYRGSVYWYSGPPTRSQQSLLQKKKSYQELNTSYYDPERVPDYFYVLTAKKAESLLNMQNDSREWHHPDRQVDEAVSGSWMDNLGNLLNRLLQNPKPGPGSN